MKTRIALFAALAAGSAASLFPAAATPTPRAEPTRTITLRLANSGLATWSTDSSDDKYTQALKYKWTGTFTFKLATRVIKNAGRAKFVTSARGTLTAAWTGVVDGRKLTGADAGPYKCAYSGADVKAPVRAILTNGPARGKISLTLHPPAGAQGFISPQGDRRTINCTSTFGQSGPPHFSPAALFRDTYLDHRLLSTTNAVIGLPATVLQRRSATVTFPRETGRKSSPFLGQLVWRNRGKLVVRPG